jgi:hypothetical protein
MRRNRENNINPMVPLRGWSNTIVGRRILHVTSEYRGGFSRPPLTGDVIVASVAIIPFAQLLRYRPIGASTVLAIGVMSFAACVALYWRVISTSLGIAKAKKSPEGILNWLRQTKER